jgi:hypothetical protein
MSLFNSYDRTKFLDELNQPVHTKAGIVSPSAAKAKARTNLGAVAAGDIPVAAHQANSVAADVATLVTDFNALLAKLQAAGLMASS